MLSDFVRYFAADWILDMRVFISLRPNNATGSAAGEHIGRVLINEQLGGQLNLTGNWSCPYKRRYDVSLRSNPQSAGP